MTIPGIHEHTDEFSGRSWVTMRDPLVAVEYMRGPFKETSRHHDYTASCEVVIDALVHRIHHLEREYRRMIQMYRAHGTEGHMQVADKLERDLNYFGGNKVAFETTRADR